MSEAKKDTVRRLRGAPPDGVKELGFVYEDAELDVLYVTRKDGSFVTMQRSDIRSTYVGRHDRRSLERAIMRVRHELAGDVGKSIASMFQACALLAAGKVPNALHWRDAGYVTLCGVGVAPHSVPMASEVTKVTCRECRTKLVNAVMAMPFLRDDDAD